MSPTSQQSALQPALARGARQGRHAVVLSGGGANGAYEVGVLRALFGGLSPSTGGVPLAADVFTGTSVGAYNAAFLAQAAGPGHEAARRLEEIWRRRIAETVASCGNGVYRLRADPFRWLDPGCLRQPAGLLIESAMDAAFWVRYGLQRGAFFLTSDEPVRVKALQTFDFAALFSETPLNDLIKETIDLGRLARSPKELAVTATDWTHGVPRVFHKAEIIDRYGAEAIMASTAIPGIFPPVELDNVPYVDGGLLMNTPFKPAIDAGSDVLHVVYVDPRVVDIPFPEIPNSLDTFYRIYAIAVAGNINADALVAGMVNEDVETAERLGVVRKGRRLRDAGPGLRRLRRVAAHAERGKPYRPLTIHFYRPRVPLGSANALLDFRAAPIDARIAQGHSDAVLHDCGEAQCVLPPQVAAQAGL